MALFTAPYRHLVKKTVSLLLLLTTTFYLFGGYTLAASLTQSSLAKTETRLASGSHTVLTKGKSSLLQLLNQLVKNEDNEDDELGLGPVLVTGRWVLCLFTPVFSGPNKHFLIYYATAIKAKLPHPNLLNNLFRI